MSYTQEAYESPREHEEVRGPHKQMTAKEPQVGLGKLAKRFYGPFNVLECIDEVSYHLQLPEGARIHSVFHCSLLKPFKGSPKQSEIVSLP